MHLIIGNTLRDSTCVRDIAIILCMLLAIALKLGLQIVVAS